MRNTVAQMIANKFRNDNEFLVRYSGVTIESVLKRRSVRQDVGTESLIVYSFEDGSRILLDCDTLWYIIDPECVCGFCGEGVYIDGYMPCKDGN